MIILYFVETHTQILRFNPKLKTGYETRIKIIIM